MLEVVYSEFIAQLKAAGPAGARIEKHQKSAWTDYVREKKVLEAACRVHAKALADPLKVVIIRTDDDWDGYYIYSPSDEVALRFSRD